MKFVFHLFHDLLQFAQRKVKPIFVCKIASGKLLFMH